MAWPALRPRLHSLALALTFYAGQYSPDLMDRGAYALAAAFFGWALLRDASWLIPRPAAAPVVERLALQTGSGAAFLPLDEISRLKAAGHYTEVYRANGDVVLDDRGLTAMMEALETARPGRFMRVHRSWAVDLDRAERLASQEGSRYRLRLADETEVPVSRDKVAALRAKLGG
jgi:DNA-binding LytR/AlgR family response regulator